MSTELVCDFVGGSVGHRHRFGGGRGQALPKACGLKGNKTPSIIDATAGLGRDSFLLASLGCSVIMIERNSTMYQLLLDGMEKAKEKDSDYADIISRMKLIHGDAKDIIPTLNSDVILIDPMHPPRIKSALVKKEMRLIRDIVGTDPDAKDLLEIALRSNSERIVLKWPMKAEPIEGVKKPSHQITGKSTRYDVFMNLS